MDVEARSLQRLPEGRIGQIGTAFAGPAGQDPRVLSAAELDAMAPYRGDADWACLTEALYFEARGEAVIGQYAVAEVILNSVDDPRYPGTICAVVEQGNGRRHACQFSYTCDGLHEDVTDVQAWHRLGQIAQIMMSGAPRDLTGAATHYHAEWVRPRWADVYPRTARHGAHMFYRRP